MTYLPRATQSTTGKLVTIGLLKIWNLKDYTSTLTDYRCYHKAHICSLEWRAAVRSLDTSYNFIGTNYTENREHYNRLLSLFSRKLKHKFSSMKYQTLLNLYRATAYIQSLLQCQCFQAYQIIDQSGDSLLCFSKTDQSDSLFYLI